MRTVQPNSAAGGSGSTFTAISYLRTGVCPYDDTKWHLSPVIFSCGVPITTFTAGYDGPTEWHVCQPPDADPCGVLA